MAPSGFHRGRHWVRRFCSVEGVLRAACAAGLGAPPGWVFGPVWTVLYALMAVAAWLVWRSGGFSQNKLALGFFLVQPALNAFWSWLFFGWRFGGWAFAEILALLAALAITFVLFWRARPAAGALLIPYFLWLVFAAALNYSIWQMNPQLLG